MSSEPEDYQTGRGKPPKTYQFKKGQSGNPKGRPRNTEDAGDIIGRIEKERIAMVINGKRKMVDVTEAVIRAQIAHCLKKGDPRALEQLLGVLKKNGLSFNERLRQFVEDGSRQFQEKMFQYLDRTHDQAGEDDMMRRNAGECDLIFTEAVLATLKERWKQEDEEGVDPKWKTYVRRAVEARLTTFIEQRQLTSPGD